MSVEVTFSLTLAYSFFSQKTLITRVQIPWTSLGESVRLEREFASKLKPPFLVCLFVCFFLFADPDNST